jgi:hypothetical protein
LDLHSYYGPAARLQQEIRGKHECPTFNNPVWKYEGMRTFIVRRAYQVSTCPKGYFMLKHVKNTTNRPWTLEHRNNGTLIIGNAVSTLSKGTVSSAISTMLYFRLLVLTIAVPQSWLLFRVKQGQSQSRGAKS